MSLSIQNANDIVMAIEEREISLGGQSSQHVQDHLTHVLGAAYIARIIASKIPELNSDEIYVSTLLHDIGRLEESRVRRFHGIIGYEKLKDKDEKAARTALIHMFPWSRLPDFEQCSNWFFQNRRDYDFVSNYLQNTEVREEDLLIQLADSLANKNGFVTLKERFEEYEKRHGEALSKEQVLLRYQLKAHFDKRIGCNVYDLFPKKVQTKTIFPLVIERIRD